MVDYAKRIQAGAPPVDAGKEILEQRQKPVVTTPAPNGQDSGEDVDTRRRRAWIQLQYRKRCDAVTDKEQAAKLLQDPQVLEFEARIKGDEVLLGEFQAVRQAMIDRLWPGA